MDLSTVEIPRAEARQSYLEYRRQARVEQDPEARRELEEIARALRISATKELPLIALTPTIERGGTVVRTKVERRWSSQTDKHEEFRTNYLLPRLAVCNAAAQFVFTLGIHKDGQVQFVDSLRRRDDYESGRLALETGFELPHGFQAGERCREWDGAAWSAMVPVTPPKHRPRPNANMSKLLVLWEADDWTWRTTPQPPGDPALLQHVAGDIYAVLATWDLTELERLVLSGRRL